MKTLDREHVRSVVNTIFSQLLHTTSIDVINSSPVNRKIYRTFLYYNPGVPFKNYIYDQ